MSTQLSFENVSLEFGETAILRDANFVLGDGERVCLIGRNGAGKSTMLKLVAGTLHPDRGTIKRRAELRVAQLSQTLPETSGRTVREFVADGLAPLAAAIDEFERLAAGRPDAAQSRRLERLQRQIEAQGGWHVAQRVAQVLSELDLPGELRLGELSGGWRRRVALAQAIVACPDLLLLDEPTNHLDFAAIAWLEDRVLKFPGSVLFITHDRAFLQRLATRIVEIDRGRLTDWPGDYRGYLEHKAQALADEARANALFDKKLAQEEAWIRRGIKARRTRNEGRVRALEQMREEAAARVSPLAAPRLHALEAETSSRIVIEARDIVHGYGAAPIVDGVSLTILRGERIGLIGNNGVGKSTLLRILLGALVPDAGSVRLAPNLAVGYFDQTRSAIEPEKTVAEFVGDESDHVVVGGGTRHVIGYLTDFLFDAERARTPIKALSGGERSRVMLARLFTRPANLLVLDEPTNDLDVETLEVLETKLREYAGTLIVVSHDRAFMDAVVDTVLVFEEGRRIVRYAGGYSDWLARDRRLARVDEPRRRDSPATDERPIAARPEATRPSGKLSYKLKRELDELPARIDTLESEIAALAADSSDPEFYRRPPRVTQSLLVELADKQRLLDELIARWAELESM